MRPHVSKLLYSWSEHVMQEGRLSFIISSFLQCHQFVEHNEEHIEKWYFHLQNNEPDFEKWLCIKTAEGN